MASETGAAWWRTAAPASAAPDNDPLGLGTARRRTASWLIGLGLGLVATILVGVGVGAFSVPPGTVARVVTHHLVG